jgi:hypothetical protein
MSMRARANGPGTPPAPAPAGRTKLRWPPRPLGLGTPLDLAAASQELLYRLLVATIVAWLAHVALARFTGRPEAWARWLGCSPPPTGVSFGGQ